MPDVHHPLTLISSIVNKGVGANMLKVGSKRRRTKAEIEDEKEQEALKQQKLESDLQELANLRGRIQEAEEQANTNKAAAELMSQMINAGHVQQDAQDQVMINAAAGIQRFGVGLPPQQIVPR